MLKTALERAVMQLCSVAVFERELKLLNVVGEVEDYLNRCLRTVFAVIDHYGSLSGLFRKYRIRIADKAVLGHVEPQTEELNHWEGLWMREAGPPFMSLAVRPPVLARFEALAV